MNNQNNNDRFSVFKKLGSLIVVPRILVNLLRNEDELTALGANKLLGNDNLNDVFVIISKRLNEQKNLIRNDKQKVLDYYFSNTGREMLEMQAVIDEEEKEVEAMRKKAMAATKLIKRKIKVQQNYKYCRW